LLGEYVLLRGGLAIAAAMDQNNERGDEEMVTKRKMTTCVGG